MILYSNHETLARRMSECERNRPILDAQKQHWNEAYSEEDDFFGEEPSYPAKKALDIFKKTKKTKILELGAGQGRDTLFFAKNGIQISAIDFSEVAVTAIRQRAQSLGLSELLTVVTHDVRKPLPFEDKTFDACYCHMLYCMALCTTELEELFQEVRRVLKPDGVNIYTVRQTGDPHFRKGIHLGEDIYENEGFIVHFFSREKVQHLAKGYRLVNIEEFEEGELPRKLFLVELRKIE